MPAPPGNSNPTTHGIYSLRDQGPSKLQDPAKIDRLVELREMVKTEPGRRDIREELTARMALICEMGYARLAEQHKAGDDIWATDVMKRLQGFVAETRRLLDSFGQQDGNFEAEHERIKKVLENESIKQHIGSDRSG